MFEVNAFLAYTARNFNGNLWVEFAHCGDTAENYIEQQFPALSPNERTMIAFMLMAVIDKMYITVGYGESMLISAVNENKPFKEFLTEVGNAIPLQMDIDDPDERNSITETLMEYGA